MKRVIKPRMSPAQIHAWMRKHSGGRLILGEVGGELWWTDSYILTRVEPIVESLLAEYNLTPEPMTCSVGRTIRRTDAKVPNLDGLVKVAVDAKRKPLGRFTINGAPILVDGTQGPALVWTTGENPEVTIDRAKVDLIELLHAGGGWTADPRKPHNAAVYEKDGTAHALAMPIRNILTDAAKAAA